MATSKNVIFNADESMVLDGASLLDFKSMHMTRKRDPPTSSPTTTTDAYTDTTTVKDEDEVEEENISSCEESKRANNHKKNMQWKKGLPDQQKLQAMYSQPDLSKSHPATEQVGKPIFEDITKLAIAPPFKTNLSFVLAKSLSTLATATGSSEMP